MRDHGGEHHTVGGASRPAEPSAALVARLAATDVTRLDDHALVEHIAATERAIAWLTSAQHDALVELARRPASTGIRDVDGDARVLAEPGEQTRAHIGDEVSLRLTTSPRAAENRVDLACALRALPLARAALRAGRIDVARARVVIEACTAVDPATARAMEARCVEQAERLTPARLRRALRRTIIAVDPAAARERELRARAERRVVLTPLPDGMCELYALLPAADGVAIRDVLTAAARATKKHDPTEPRSTDQLRADILGEVFRNAMATGRLLGRALGRSAGRACELQVTVAATTLLGHDREPGSLRGFGPVTADAVAELAPDSSLRRLLTDPLDGTVLDIGRTSYRPTADIARHVRARHPMCTFPTCNRPAVQCELDHVVPFPDGPTSAENLRPRCKRHHLFKHSAGVEVEELADGSTRWLLPTGHRFVNRPEPALHPSDAIRTADPPALPPF